MTGMKFRSIGAIAMGLAAFAMTAMPAEAKRGGSFGSRGSRTAVAPATTATAPKQVAPVQRSMTEKAPAQSSASQRAAASAAPAKQSRFGGMGKGLLGGLIAGGLIGMLLGNGFGALNGSGILMALLQVALIGGLVWFGLRMFRRRPAMAPAGARAGAPGMSAFTASRPQEQQHSGWSKPFPASGASAAPVTQELAISLQDKEEFERLLTEVQDAFSREDYARLRASTTPEVMSYLAEDLSVNAGNGLRNEVSATELLDAEVAEAWSEAGADYATIAMQYQSIDIMRDRDTGAVVEGDPTTPTRTTELWTFVRRGEGFWMLSAIQQA
ncbi:TIM44-like domain-containing protein [Novosphingobium sp. M1R2S20]|uniref:TIM44-like domain-containing protein n=1 Tax=Novosphingobium rhizovicinum TaxID=3228928 RepID=A0ABV3RE01_9SPHN